MIAGSIKSSLNSSSKTSLTFVNPLECNPLLFRPTKTSPALKLFGILFLTGFLHLQKISALISLATKWNIQIP